MKTNNWMNENKVKGESKVNIVEEKNSNVEEKNSNVCGRSYNEEASFSQINFQTYQNILDKRNELLSTVKHS